MKRDKIYIPLISVLIFAMLYLIHQNRNLVNEQDLLSHELVSLRIDSLAFQTEKGKMMDSITFQREVILSERQAADLLRKELSELKSIKQNTKITTVVEYIDRPIPAVDPVITESLPDGDYMKIPQSFKDSSAHFTLSASLLKTGLQLNSLRIQNTTSISVGMRRKSFFHRAKPVVMVSHSNPMVQTSGLTNITIQQEKSFFDSRGFNLAAGAFIMFIITR